MSEHDSTNDVLNMNGIKISFGGVKALKGVNFSLKAGEVHALCGENGAGKSTLIKALMGINKLDSGEILMDGKPADIKNPIDAAKKGVTAVFQELSQIPTLTVAENVFLTKEPVKALGVMDRAAMAAETQKILDEYGIELDPRSVSENLSTAKRQMCEITKAIAVKPRILILDEPTSSLTTVETEILFKIIAYLKANGTSIIYITHRMNEIFRCADRVTVLRDGVDVITCPANEIDLDGIVKGMVGREVDLFNAKNLEQKDFSGAPEVLRVENLSGNGISDVSFSLKKGEVLGFAGLVGSGRTELMQLIFGLKKPTAGTITIGGSTFKSLTTRTAIKEGLAMVPEDRRLEGLTLMHDIENNTILPDLEKYANNYIVDRKKVTNIANAMISELGIKAESSKMITNLLSGGNQQKVVIGKWLAMNPRIFILDEPTAGIDVQSKSEIHKLIRELADEGMSIILVSSDMTELLNNATRVIIMSDGQIIGEGQAPTQEEIMSAIMKFKSKSSKGDLEHE